MPILELPRSPCHPDERTIDVCHGPNATALLVSSDLMLKYLVSRIATGPSVNYWQVTGLESGRMRSALERQGQKIMRARRAIATCVSVLLILTGCGIGPPYRAYEGPKLALDQVARVEEFYGKPWDSRFIFIRQVDDEYIIGFRSSIELKPGQHRLYLYYADQTDMFFNLCCYYEYYFMAIFEAQAGHIYKLQGKGGYGKIEPSIDVWLTDQQTQSIVWQDSADASKPGVIYRHNKRPLGNHFEPGPDGWEKVEDPWFEPFE